jgi:NADH-quinone oxidoreductase subunit J
VILFLFGLMLTKAPIGRDTLDNQQRWLGALVGLGIFVGLVYLINQAWPFGDTPAVAATQGTTGLIGDELFRNYVLPFEAVSFLLLAALVGAIVLARKDEGN